VTPLEKGDSGSSDRLVLPAFTDGSAKEFRSSANQMQKAADWPPFAFGWLSLTGYQRVDVGSIQ
jgi:hypothetical protein